VLNNLDYMAGTTQEESTMEPTGNIKLSTSKEFSVKRFALGTLCVLLAMALGACSEESSPSSSSPGGRDNPIEWDGEGYLVIFDENGGDTLANPQNKIVLPPETTVDALPEPPTREGHNFMGWNMEADGSGMPFTTNTPVSEHLRVYAQWELSSAVGTPSLSVSISPSAEILTPMLNGAYSERSTTFAVVVSGLASAAEANNTRLSISVTNGLLFAVESNPTNNTQNFNVTVGYDGEAAFPEGVATFSLFIHVPGYETESRTTRVNIRDGLAAESAIPLNEGNILHFNSYVRTAAGLVRHYRLAENISLNTSSNNWTAIGTSAAPFMGSLNGDGHTLYGIRISNSSTHQGFFSYIGENAVIENLGLTDVSVSAGQYTGGLVGYNRGGIVRSCYTTGVVSGQNDTGGLVGQNRGTVHNSYAATNVWGHGNTGGLVGRNFGTVEHVYATGIVDASVGRTSARQNVGGLVGGNDGTLRNSLALNSRVNVSYQIYEYPNGGGAVLVTRCSTNNVGRVTGTAGTLSGNYAFSGMLNCLGATLSSSTNANSTQGENRTASALQVPGGFPAALRTTPWTYEAERLPGLGQSVAMPSHLR